MWKRIVGRRGMRWFLGVIGVGAVAAVTALCRGDTPPAAKSGGVAVAESRQTKAPPVQPSPSVPPSPLVPPAPPYRDISPEEAMRRLGRGEKAVLLDVRTPAEHAEKKIPGSVLLPLGPPDDMDRLARKLIPDKDTPLFVYCRSGRRSVEAANILAALGYRNVYNLGGIMNWPYATE